MDVRLTLLLQSIGGLENQSGRPLGYTIMPDECFSRGCERDDELFRLLRVPASCRRVAYTLLGFQKSSGPIPSVGLLQP